MSEQGNPKPIQRVMLLIPPYMDAVSTLGGSPTSEQVVFPPLQLGYLGTHLQKHGYEIKISCLPAGPWDTITRELEEFSPDLVGMTCYSYTYKSATDAANLVKYLLPDAKVVFGGHHVCKDNASDILRNHPNVDYLIIGEGEHSMLGLVETVNSGGDLEAVNGVVFRRDGEACFAPKRKVETKIDKFDIDYTLMDLTRLPSYYDRPDSEYTYIGKRFGVPERTRMSLLITSRGCVGKCKFCSAPRAFQMYRNRDPELILDELQHLHEEYGFNYFHFSSATFPQQKSKDKKMLQGIIDRNLDIYWSAQSRGDDFDPELIGLIRDSGCINMNFGVESGSNDLMHVLGKNRDNRKLKQTMIECAKAGIPVAGSFLHNFPGSTREHYLGTVEFIWDMAGYGCFAHGHRMWIEINTDLYDIAIEQGCIANHNYWETPLLRSPRFNAPTQEELHSFVMFILFMRMAFHLRQFGDFIETRPLTIVEKDNPWRCRLMIELARVGYKKREIDVYADEAVESSLREVLLEEELKDIVFHPYSAALSPDISPKVLFADAREAERLDAFDAMSSRPATVKIRFDDYPRGGLSAKGESIEKGVWDYETDDLVDIDLYRPEQETGAAKRIGVVIEDSHDLVERIDRIRSHYPDAELRILTLDQYLPHVAQHLKMRDKVDFVLRQASFCEDIVRDRDKAMLEGLEYDLMIVLGKHGRHHKYRQAVSFLRRFFPDNNVLGLCGGRWFIISWLPINETWYHFRLRS